MLAGDFYIADDPENARLNQRGFRLGEGAHITPPLFVDYGANIHVGAGTFVE